ncbi:MAG TPA: calcium-binding EGF-like domain-containing protein, partial [Polyangiaceae bacterium]|nr:calcium-binding EGF-like domain-containing protein [Polyangiaceae bacterium]
RVCDCTGTGATGVSCEVDINECDPNPCEHGTCDNGINEYTCDCAGTGYSGTNCQTNVDDCASDPCQHGGECTDGVNDYTCDCSGTGYSGTNCQTNVDDCASEPCRNGGDCTDGVNDYTCSCPAPWEGPNCDSATLTVDATVRGYYTDADWFQPTTLDSFAGKAAVIHRAFFVFSIPDFEGTVSEVTFRLEIEELWTDISETLGFYDVSTSIPVLVDLSGDWPAIYADLGEGTQYATHTVGWSHVNTIRSIELSSAASMDVSLARGEEFAIGVAVTTIATDGYEQGVRFVVDGEESVQSLEIVVDP